MKKAVLFLSILLLTACSKTPANQVRSDSYSTGDVLGNSNQTNNLATESSTISPTNQPVLSPTTKPTVQPTVQTTSTKAVMLKEPQELLKIKAGQKIFATLKTSVGDIEVELFADKTPKTVGNFVGLAEGTQPWSDPKSGNLIENKPLYSSVIFHRVIKEFMIQGGDPLGVGVGGPGYKFEDEIVPELKFSEPGLLAMANAGPGTNGSQFFITTVPTSWLNGKHTIFGKVTKGMDVVTKIENTPVGAQDKPVTPITINSIEIKRI